MSAEKAAQCQAGHENGKHGGHGHVGTTKNQAEQPDPENLVNQSGDARKEKQKINS